MAIARPTAPFGDDYPEVRSPEQCTEEAAAAQLQVRHLISMVNDPAYLDAVLRRLQARGSDTAQPRIEQIDGPDGRPVFVAAQRFLVAREELTRNRGQFDQLPYRVVDADPRTRVVTLEADRRRVERDARTPDLLKELTDAGLSVAYDYILPLGPVIKAAGGPEPSAGTRPFPAVEYEEAGSPARVFVIDTGVSLEERTDGYLQDLLRPDNLDALDVLPFPNPDRLLDAGAGHGSFVTGIVQQVAPTATIRVLKATRSDGIGTDDDVADAVRRAVDGGAQIVNLSLGTSTADGNCPAAILAAIEDAVAAQPDILFVVAAGNDGPNGTEVWPAALATSIPQVVAVAGLDAAGAPSGWSSRGGWVSCAVRAEGVLSTYVIGTEDGPLIGDPAPDTYLADSWATWTGTSFAAPQITGAVARLCHERGLTPAAAFAAVVAGAPTDPDWGSLLTILPGTP